MKESKLKKFKDGLEEFCNAAILPGMIVGVFSGAVLSGALFGMAKHLDKQQRKELYQEASVITDINSDEEWAEVYKQFDINYDIYKSNPVKDLTTEQFREYLSRK